MSLALKARRILPTGLVLALALLACGCASRGNPRPPSLHLPEAAAHLTAVRIGDQVALTWITSDKTSDGVLMRGPITAVVCRDAVVGSAINKPGRTCSCTPMQRIAASPGFSRATDTLPPDLAQDPPRLLAYRIELQNARGRSAGPSLPAFTLGGAAPANPGPLHITAAPRGAIVTWSQALAVSTSGDTVMELTRTLVPETATSPPLAPKPHPPATATSPTRADSTTPVLLRTAQRAGSASGGMLDPGALPHNTYMYTAQQIRTLSVDGRSLEIRSSPSPIAAFVFRDVFPPKAPTGLESIASAPLAAQNSIDLSWEPSPEPDILGYNVYRADASTGLFIRLNATVLPAPAFRDLTAAANHTYRYRVTAVDRAQNESSPGAELSERIRKP